MSFQSKRTCRYGELIPAVAVAVLLAGVDA